MKILYCGELSRPPHNNNLCFKIITQETLKLLVRILRSPGCRKFPVLAKSADDVILAATKFVSERLCPIFQVTIPAEFKI